MAERAQGIKGTIYSNQHGFFFVPLDEEGKEKFYQLKIDELEIEIIDKDAMIDRDAEVIFSHD